MTAQAAGKFVIKGKHVLIAMLVFFGGVIAVNALFITLALNSFPGEDVRRSYLQGLHYNETLRERAQQAALGWRASAAIAEDGASLIIVLRDHEHRPVEHAQLQAQLRRPAESASDEALAFTPMGDGRYRAALNALRPGVWDLRLTATRGEDRFDLQRRLTWAPPPPR